MGVTPIRSSGFSPGDGAPATGISLVVALLAASAAVAGCDAVSYDFGILDGGCAPPPPEGAECGDLPAVDGGCEQADGCTGQASVDTVAIGETLGCTPAGLSLGLLSLSWAGAPAGVDLFAWAPSPGGESFSKGAFLSVFGDPCGEEPPGADLECPYRPWLLERGMTLDEDIYLHVQTDEEEEVGVTFQLLPSDGWDASLPGPGESVACSTGPGGHLRADLVNHPLWNGDARDLDLGRSPPALDGEPWMCGASAGGWRQVGFLLRNQGDDPVVATDVHLERVGEEGVDASFHWAVLGCSAEGDIPAGASAIASSCQGPEGPEPASASITFDVWVPEHPSTEYALILQVPPSAAALYRVRLHIEGLAENG